MKNDFFCGKKRKIHFIGAGGASMSGLIKYCLVNGFSVTGSDRTVTPVTKRLNALGAKVFKGHRAENVGEADCVVYTSALEKDNPELKFAREKGLPVIKRSEFLGKIMAGYPLSVAVSGSHGKTTVTAMIADILTEANFNPTVFLGGESRNFGNFRSGGKDIVVAEACEYRRNFLDIKPSVAVILNIDNDHVDTFRDMKDETEAFSLFAKNSLTVLNADDKNANSVFNSSTVTFGIKNLANYTAAHISAIPAAFTVFASGKRLGRIKLKLSGLHNVYDALAAVAVCRELKVPFSAVKRALERFDGVKRRNEFIGELSGVPCYADYAHHPTEIAAILRSKRGKKLVAFQPHTYSRTEALMKDFVSALSGADGLIIYKTYPARERYSEKGDGERLFENLKQVFSGEIFYACDYSSLARFCAQKANNYDEILFVGAGDIYEAAKKCVREEKNKKISDFD